MFVRAASLPWIDERRRHGALVLLLLATFLLQGFAVRLHAHAYSMRAPETALADVHGAGKVPAGQLPPADRDPTKCQVCLAAAFAASFVAASGPVLAIADVDNGPAALPPLVTGRSGHHGAWRSRAPPTA